MLIIRCGLGGLGIVRARICAQCAPWPLALVLLVVVLSLRIAKLGCRYSSYRVVAVMTWVVCRIMSQACVSFSKAMRRGSACVTCVILRKRKENTDVNFDRCERALWSGNFLPPVEVVVAAGCVWVPYAPVVALAPVPVVVSVPELPAVPYPVWETALEPFKLARPRSISSLP